MDTEINTELVVAVIAKGTTAAIMAIDAAVHELPENQRRHVADHIGHQVADAARFLDSLPGVVRNNG